MNITQHHFILLLRQMFQWVIINKDLYNCCYAQCQKRILQC